VFLQLVTPLTELLLSSVYTVLYLEMSPSVFKNKRHINKISYHINTLFSYMLYY
jgi:hypothetical protein